MFICHCRSQLFKLCHIFRYLLAIFMLILCSWPTFWWRGMNTYLVFFVFPSRPTRLLTLITASVFYSKTRLFNPMPVTAAARSMAWTLFARSDAGIGGSNPTQGIMFGVCMRLFCVCVILCLGRGLATGWLLAQGALPSVKKWLRYWIRDQGP
jgi:hypothetical protein